MALSATGTNSAEDVEAGKKKGDYAIGMSFSVSGAKLGIGYDNYKATSLGVGYSTGAISVNALYSSIKESNETYMFTYDNGTPANDDDDADISISSPKLTSIGVDTCPTRWVHRR